MKICIGLFIIVILLIASCGCTTQQPRPVATTQPTPAENVTETPAAPVTTPVQTSPEMVNTTVVPSVTANITIAVTTRPVMAPSTKITTIHIRNKTFVPDQLTVLPGTRITWINDDSVTHIVKSSGDAAGKFTSAELINGAQFGYTFGEATGTFEFTDPNYPDMKGAIIVKKGETLWIATFVPTTTAAR